MMSTDLSRLGWISGGLVELLLLERLDHFCHRVHVLVSLIKQESKTLIFLLVDELSVTSLILGLQQAKK